MVKQLKLLIPIFTNLRINTHCDLPCYGLHVAKNSRWLELAPFVNMMAGYSNYYIVDLWRFKDIWVLGLFFLISKPLI